MNLGIRKSAIQSGVALLDISLASGRHLFELGEDAQGICRDNTGVQPKSKFSWDLVLVFGKVH
jgi:hypothetical protein